MAQTTDRDVLRAIQLLDQPTRQRIARFVGLSGPSVAPYLARLRDQGLIEPAGKTPSGGGRPALVYALTASAGCTIGVFLETSVCQIVAADPSGRPILERSHPVSLAPRTGSAADEVVRVVSAQIRGLREDPAMRGRRVLAVGVTAPGMVDTARGVWLHGLRLSGVEHVRLAEQLEPAIGLPVLVEDEARCMAHLASIRLGPDPAGNLLLVYLGTGVGAGLYLDGRIYRGDRGMAGEIGHLVVEQHGDRCPCGSSGCLETVASLPAVLRRFRRRLEAGVVSSLQDVDAARPLTLERISTAADTGDRLTRATIAEVGRAIGDACGKAVAILNPRILCIAGPVSSLAEHLRDALWARIDDQVVPEMAQGLRLEFLPYRTGDEALGAARLAARWYWSAAADVTPSAPRSSDHGRSTAGRTGTPG